MAATKEKRRKRSKGLQIRLKGLADRVALVEKPLLRNDLPDYGPGDVVRVHVRIKEGEKERLQVYEGIVIAKSNRGGGKSFIVRKISHGVGVERIFMENSPKIAKLEIVHEGRVRRAKLYYLRALEGKAARVQRETESSARENSPPTQASNPSKEQSSSS